MAFHSGSHEAAARLYMRARSIRERLLGGPESSVKHLIMPYFATLEVFFFSRCFKVFQ